MLLLKCGVRYQEAPSLLYLRQDAKQQRIDEFKQQLAAHFLLYKTSWGVITDCTMKVGCSAQPQRGQRHKGLFEEQKTELFSLICLQSPPAAQSGLAEISTVLQNREQGYHIMNRSTAADQLTLHAILSMAAWETLARSSSVRAEVALAPKSQLDWPIPPKIKSGNEYLRGRSQGFLQRVYSLFEFRVLDFYRQASMLCVAGVG